MNTKSQRKYNRQINQTIHHENDPSIFNSPNDNKEQKSIHNLINYPIKITKTLKEIGLDGLDSPTPDKTNQIKKLNNEKKKRKPKTKVGKIKKQTNSSNSQNKELLRPTYFRKIQMKNDEINQNNFIQNSIRDDSSDDSYDIFTLNPNENEDDYSSQELQNEIKNHKEVTSDDDEDSFSLNLMNIKNLKVSKLTKKDQAASRSPKTEKKYLYVYNSKISSSNSSFLPGLRKH